MTKPAETTPAETAVVRETFDSSENHTLADILALQQTAFLRDGIPDIETRKDRINRLEALILDNADELAAAVNDDFGTRPWQTTYAADIMVVAEEIGETRHRLEAWARPDRNFSKYTLTGVSQQVRKDPLGVVGIVGPWNFPLNLIVVPAASALAAGNRVMMRPSSVTAKMTAVLAKHAPKYFPLDELAVVTSAHGGGGDFSKLPFDLLFFTGSPEVGASIAKDAAENLTPVALELGGKNPVVVDTEADITKAANRIADTRLINGGQVCLCPDYVYVPEDKIGEFTDKVLARWRKRFPTIVNNTEYTSTVNEKNYRRILGLIDDAVSLGATKHQVVPAGESLPSDAERKIAPTLLTGVKAGMKVEEDEVFGPVLTVYPYRELSEAISHINAHPHPLTMYWFGPRNDRYETLLGSTRSGSVNGNDFGLNMLGGVPFGGVGRSGMGSYHGKYGFDTFTHHRTVGYASNPVVSFADIFAGPYKGYESKAIKGRVAAMKFLLNRRLKK